VTNTAASARTLRFLDGQAGEVVVRRADGVAYRWSDGRAFTQALWRRTLRPKQSWRFSLTGSPGIRVGRYQLVATVTTSQRPRPVARARIRVVEQ
jgi:Intracellular proteinase inhibitor